MNSRIGLILPLFLVSSCIVDRELDFAAAIFTTKDFSFFIGTDSYIFRVTPQMIPAGKANLSLTFGVSHAL